jgi:hypothetical protein
MIPLKKRKLNFGGFKPQIVSVGNSDVVATVPPKTFVPFASGKNPVFSPIARNYVAPLQTFVPFASVKNLVFSPIARNYFVPVQSFVPGMVNVQNSIVIPNFGGRRNGPFIPFVFDKKNAPKPLASSSSSSTRRRKVVTSRRRKKVVASSSSSSRNRNVNRSKDFVTEGLNKNGIAVFSKLRSYQISGEIKLFLNSGVREKDNILSMDITGNREKFYSWEETSFIPGNVTYDFKLEKSKKDMSGKKFFDEKRIGKRFEAVDEKDYRIILNEKKKRNKCVFGIWIGSFKYRKIFFRLTKRIYSNGVLYAETALIFRKRLKNAAEKSKLISEYRMTGYTVKNKPTPPPVIVID